MQVVKLSSIVKKRDYLHNLQRDISMCRANMVKLSSSSSTLSFTWLHTYSSCVLRVKSTHGSAFLLFLKVTKVYLAHPVNFSKFSCMGDTDATDDSANGEEVNLFLRFSDPLNWSTKSCLRALLIVKWSVIVIQSGLGILFVLESRLFHLDPKMKVWRKCLHRQVVVPMMILIANTGYSFYLMMQVRITTFSNSLL